MIKNIIFDLGGVLLDIDLIHCMKQIQALGVDMDAFSANTSHHPLHDDTKPAVMGEGIVANGVVNLYQVGGITTEDFLACVQQACHPGTTRQQVLDAWNTCCIGIPQYRLDKVKELRERGYHLYMLSNTNDAHWQDIVQRCFGGEDVVNGLFEHVFLSQEMHLAKPNEDIYLKVLEDTHAKAEECLFIDDSTPNVEAAAALGFRTIHADVSATRDGKVVAPPATDWPKTIDLQLATLANG
ncbi:MAG: HAD family phosphatase [Bacteroidaceae bacterium]|nr:HAD family phosphatase [Bacteroidaceae bacterium]